MRHPGPHWRPPPAAGFEEGWLTGGILEGPARSLKVLGFCFGILVTRVSGSLTHGLCFQTTSGCLSLLAVNQVI